MPERFKRFCAAVLILMMIISMVPTVETARAAELTQDAYIAADALFDQIDAMEMRSTKRSTTQDQLTDAAVEIVLAADNYVEGSLERAGDSFTWWTDGGIRCIYSPRMRRIEEDMSPPEDTAQNVIVNEPKATKGGSASGNQVYLIGPYYGHDDEFTDQYKIEARRVAAAIGDTDGYTLYSGTAATVDKVAEAVSNGAVVFFDSHGITDYENGYDCVTGATNSYLCLTSTTGLTREDYDDGALYYSDGICINGATIANHMTGNSPGGIVWMALCLGMATDTLCEPLRQQGVEVVYGYSQSVSFAGDYLFEETFWDEMTDGHTVAESIATMKDTWGNWDWSTKIAKYYGYYDGYTTISAARRDYSSFPVVVSDEDAHPGQRYKNSFYGACSLQDVRSSYQLNVVENVPEQPVGGSELTVGQAIAMGSAMEHNTFTDDKYKVTGVITEVYNTTYGNMYIQDGAGDVLMIYGTYDATGEVRYDAMAVKPVAGDTVTVYGVIGQYNDTPEMKDGWIIEHISAGTTEEPEVPETVDSATYTFADYQVSGEASGDSVTRELDETVTVRISSGWLTDQARIYKSAYMTVESTRPMTSMILNAGYKNSTFDLYVLDEDSEWVEYQMNIPYTSAYGDITVELPESCRGVLIDASNAQVRLKYMTVNFAAEETDSPDEPAETEVVGELDGVEGVNEDDAVYLLQQILMPELFPVTQSTDYDKNGLVNEDDAIYLLQHVLMPELFPL